jgi:pyruvate dehydrogenase E1 component
MYVQKQPKYYYITVMNENYVQPEMPKGCEEGIIKGMYLLKKNSVKNSKKVVQLLGSGAILRESIAAAEILKSEFGIDADIWSVTSFNELKREGDSVSRWNMLHPEEEPKLSHIELNLKDARGPVIATTDYMKNYADQIREFIPGTYNVLGTDGFGRSDTREKLRNFFEIDRYFITISALDALVKENVIDGTVVKDAIDKFGINADKPDPSLL